MIWNFNFQFLWTRKRPSTLPNTTTAVRWTARTRSTRSSPTRRRSRTITVPRPPRAAWDRPQPRMPSSILSEGWSIKDFKVSVNGFDRPHDFSPDDILSKVTSFNVTSLEQTLFNVTSLDHTSYNGVVTRPGVVQRDIIRSDVVQRDVIDQTSCNGVIIRPDVVQRDIIRPDVIQRCRHRTFEWVRECTSTLTWC